MEVFAVEHSIWIAAPRERVWQAITQPEELEQWYAVGCPWEIPSLKTGAEIKFYNTPTDILLATIEAVDPPGRLTLHWQPDDMYPDAALINTFLLAEENSGTRVTASQSGYEALPEGVRQEQVTVDDGAYAAIVENLKAYIEAG